MSSLDRDMTQKLSDEKTFESPEKKKESLLKKDSLIGKIWEKNEENKANVIMEDDESIYRHENFLNLTLFLNDFFKQLIFKLNYV